MQIRLTVLGSGSRSGHHQATTAHTSSASTGGAGPASCDVLVTAPVGTALSAVASGLAATVGGPDTGGTVVLYAGTERLDPARCVLGEPPLVDGAVLSLHLPGPDVLADTETADGPQLHVVAGPDAGGVHLLHPGAIRIGRSADADVPLDDPDVSRLHCTVTVLPDGRVAVADLGSTNGTALDGAAVGAEPVALAPGALLQVGESTLRLTTGPTPAALALTPDLEGHLSLTLPGGGGPQGQFPHPAPSRNGGSAPDPGMPGAGRAGSGASGASWDTSGTGHGPGAPDGGSRSGSGAPGLEQHGAAGWEGSDTSGTDWGTPATGHDSGTSGRGHAGASGWDGGTGSEARREGGSVPAQHGWDGTSGAGSPGVAGVAGVEQYGEAGWAAPSGATADPQDPQGAQGAQGAQGHGSGAGPGVASAPRRAARRGIGAWARKWVRGEEAAEAAGGEAVATAAAAAFSGARPGVDDPAALLLAALGPAPRLWSGPAGLDVTLGVGSKVALLESGALGIAGPRARLTGVARSVIAQLAALHAPGQRLEIVLLCADRARPLAERRRDWGWLGWLPHVRPAHGQDCRLLLAYDRDQAAARAGELTRRLDDGPLGVHWAGASAEAVREASYGYRGPYTLLVVDGDPGAGALRDVTGRLASHGPAAGIHVLALAESPATTPASLVAETYESACAATPAFRDCGAVALLSGDVATAVRTFAVSHGKPVPPGETATADAVSVAWAERFARALAPLKADSPATEGYRPTAATLPQTSRLLDELGLARATPASLMARWAAATDQGQSVGGLAEIVLGSGRRGPVGAELVTDGPHVLIEGPAGSGRTELLRSVAASLSAASRPDRLGLVLLDGAGGERGDGLAPCTELPHVSAHLVASDPLRMREFAQALGAELKRRAELLNGVPFAEWHALREVSDRMVSPRQPTPGELRGDLEPQRSGTLRLRSSATRTDPAGPSPLPRLVVLVDDFDALVAPGLGSTGRPAAGSVVRALEAVAREGARLGVHLVATSARPDRTADTELARLATLRVELDAPDQPGPGRGLLRYADGRAVPFQGGRVTGRIPRTATQRPTVVPVEWERMGDPPTRRPVRELGNGPTDLALLASALDRASHLVSAIPVLFPPAP
ncbi:FHA domain-containing protein [Streptomyces sp. NBC_00454]|uniref:FHA domain-containing protein n=1 Tax=Streptomyces sp. NBC_00454 TaxID=2975747 RepID=UPI0030E5971D